MIRLAALHAYPLKSGRGQTLAEAVVTPAGLPMDRAFMLIDPAGQMLTGRRLPRLVLIEARVDDEVLHLTAPGLPALCCRLADFGEAVDCTVWRDSFVARTGCRAADAALSDWLGQPVRLCFSGRPPARRVRAAPAVPLGFADAFPLLLIGEASLADLNARLARPVGMAHFRPNLVLTGAPPLAEDGWQRLRIGEVILRVVKPCERCAFITVDPETATPSPFQEPLRTLASYRNGPDGVLFGQNVIAENSGRIAVGMPVDLLE